MYINPIEILGLSDTVVANKIDNEVIKKAKRKLFAEIDLSDNGYLDYYGLSLTSGASEKAIDELNNSEKKEFYLYLANNPPLNEFLANGNEKIFQTFKQDSIFLLPEFIHFISPFIAPKFDKALLSAFEKNNPKLTKSILNFSKLISNSELNIAYKSVSLCIQNRISIIDKITKDIKNEESDYNLNNIIDIVQMVKTHFPSETLNCLPLYFQSQILKIANCINYLYNSIWDAFDSTQVPNDLAEYLLTLNIEGLNRPTFENNFKIISKKNNERIEQAQNAPLLKKWSTILLKIRDLTKNIDAKTQKSNDAFQEVNQLFDTIELNSLPSFADEIRTQIAFSIRSLSISIWNAQNDIKCALNTLDLVFEIKLNDETIIKFRKDQIDLLELQKKYKGILICHFCDENSTEDNCGITKKIYKETSRTYFPRRVQFSYAEVNIPRCKKCKDIHTKGSQRYWLFLLGGSFAGGLLGEIVDEQFIMGGLIGGAIGWLVGYSVEYSYSRNAGIKDMSDYTLQNHPILFKRMNNEGWTFSKPSA